MFSGHWPLALVWSEIVAGHAQEIQSMDLAYLKTQLEWVEQFTLRQRWAGARDALERAKDAIDHLEHLSAQEEDETANADV